MQHDIQCWVSFYQKLQKVRKLLGKLGNAWSFAAPANLRDLSNFQWLTQKLV